ncbi:nucleoside hydrolase [Promicromonospora vindobonensis]|uniref:Nucleoside hydrolase n=1 Tax=Promicromonospora vindobonensis TaxID=195748 RepID=A0ABW5VU82_9MICO
MNLFLDTDIGSDVDDALALALVVGSPELQLDGVSTVYGNTRLRAQLASRYLRLAGAGSPPVAAGAEATLSGREVWWAGHEGGLFADLDTEQVGEDGVDMLVRAVADAPGTVDVLAIGPLTNIAKALDADPAFASNVRRLVVMGGHFGDGRTAEHNIRCDVTAAQRVFSSGLDIVVGGLDLTTKVWLDSADVAQIARSGAFGDVIAQETKVWWEFNHEDRNTPHDAILALWIAMPELFTAQRVSVTVDDEGRTIEQPDEAGLVQVLDVPDPQTVRREIVRRIVAASAQGAEAR